MFISIVILDYLWLGILTKNFIIKQFGSLVKVEKGSLKVNIIAGVFAWASITLTSFIFVVLRFDNILDVFIFGSILGFLMYCMYDLTNLTFIKKYPVKFIFVDILWGTFLLMLVSVIGFIVRGFLI